MPAVPGPTAQRTQEHNQDPDRSLPGRSGIVTATRHGSTVVYALAGGDVAELMRAAHRILTEMFAGQNQLLAELRESLTEPA